MRRCLACASILLLCASCADPFVDIEPDTGSPADSGESPFQPPQDYGAQSDVLTCRDSVDVVFVLDISSSMTAVLDTLTAEISKVVDAANKLAPDSHFGLIAFVDNHKLDTSGPLSGGKVHTAAATLSAAFSHYKAVYTAHDRNPGDGPGGPTLQNPICEENANDALYAAATEFPWRENSNRVVIIATDDTFLERPDNYGDRDGDGKTDKLDFPREGDYPAKQKLAETVAALRDNKIRVFSFTRLIPPGIFDLLRCGTGRRLPWEAVSAGWSAPYGSAEPIPAATDGKNFDLQLVFIGQLSLTETINNMVLESHCKPIE